MITDTYADFLTGKRPPVRRPIVRRPPSTSGQDVVSSLIALYARIQRDAAIRARQAPSVTEGVQ